MDVYLQAQSHVCNEFTTGGGKKQPVTVVIAPLKVITRENTLKFNSGCNFWRDCQNSKCQYSLISRPDEHKDEQEN